MTELEPAESTLKKNERPLGPPSPAITARLALIAAGALKDAASAPKQHPDDPVDAAILRQAERALDFDPAPWIVLGASAVLWGWLAFGF